jgi:hypothetical protein
MMFLRPQENRKWRPVRSRFPALLLPFAALLLWSAARAGDGGLGTVAGTVVNVSGTPVPDARVTLQGADGSAPQSTETNLQGRFFFPQLDHGYYDVRAYFNGAWSAWKHNVEVKPGKQTEVKLEIIPRKKTTP